VTLPGIPPEWQKPGISLTSAETFWPTMRLQGRMPQLAEEVLDPVVSRTGGEERVPDRLGLLDRRLDGQPGEQRKGPAFVPVRVATDVAALSWHEPVGDKSGGSATNSRRAGGSSH
jgi:hypothetical protein